MAVLVGIREKACRGVERAIKAGALQSNQAGWSKTSLTETRLRLRSLSSALTRTASYQMAICAIKHGGLFAASHS